MNKMIAALAVAAAGFATTVSAGAVEDATARDICQGHDVIAAEYLTTGQLKVICPSGSIAGATAASPALGGTALGAGAAAGAAAALVVLVVIVGDDGSITTTTTTTAGS